MVAPPGRLPHQPPERSHRPRRRDEPAAGPLTGVAKKEVKDIPSWVSSSTGSTSPSSTAQTTPRPWRPWREPRSSCAEGVSVHHLPRGHPLDHAAGGGLQEGRLPPCLAGRRADRADRHPQRWRAHVAQCQDGEGRRRGGRRSSADPDGRTGKDGSRCHGRVRRTPSTSRHLAEWPGVHAEQLEQQKGQVSEVSLEPFTATRQGPRRRRSGPTLSPRSRRLGGSTQSLTAFAASSGRPLREVREEAKGYLEEMSATHSQPVMEWWDKLGTWMLRGFDVLIDGTPQRSARTQPRALVCFLICAQVLPRRVGHPTQHRPARHEDPFRARRRQPRLLPDSARSPVEPASSTSVARPRTSLSTSTLCATSSPNSSAVTRTSSGPSRAGGRARASCDLPASGSCATSSTPSSRWTLRTSTSSRCRSSMTDYLEHEVELMTSEARGKGKTPEDVAVVPGLPTRLARRLGRVYVDFGEPIPSASGSRNCAPNRRAARQRSNASPSRSVTASMW